MPLSLIRPVMRATAAILLAGLSLTDAAVARDAPSAATPREILTGIYREAVKGATSDWLEPARRSRYLSKSLQALWAKSDAKKPPEGEVGAIDFDLTTDTNALELQDFRIEPVKQSPTAATLAVHLIYKKPYVRHDPAIVTYDFVREDGPWRIDEIRTKAWSVRDMLRRWLSGS
jgi:hypothetical protein